MYGIAFLILLPLLGWWLIRATRSLDRLATVVNENGVDLGFLSLKGKTSALLLFSDVRFVLWLARRKYQSIDVPAAVTQALEDARRDYFKVVLLKSPSESEHSANIGSKGSNPKQTR